MGSEFQLDALDERRLIDKKDQTGRINEGIRV